MELAQKRASRLAIWAWWLYDWAAQPYHTLLVTFIFAPYFTSAVVGSGVDGQALWGAMMTVVGFVLAISAPVFGAIADTTGPRKPWILALSVLTVGGAASLWFAVPGADPVWPILLAFGVGLIGVELAQIFINAMLPTLAPRHDLGPISGTGWALGYVGGVVSLIIMLVFFAENETGRTLAGLPPALGLDPETREGTRFVGPLTAAWYVVFALPFFLFTPDQPKRARVAGAVGRALRELWQTIVTLPRTPSLLAYLGSSMFYRDALNGLYTFGGIYASGVLGWSVVEIGVFGILAAVTGAIFAWIGGYADQAFGPKRVIIACILALILVCVLIVGTSRESFFGFALDPAGNFPDILFYVCGAIIGGAGGVLQAASRTFLVDQANPARMAEAFGIYALAGRATAFLAPALITVATLATGSQRLGISPIILLFAIALLLLVWVRSSEDYA